jgi:ubiquinone/menaquinone biosynthesis C-methylase UbiE
MSQVQKLPVQKEVIAKDGSYYKTKKNKFKQSVLLHDMMKQCWGVDFASPIKQELTKRKDFKVIDVGCGSSGTWLLQLSEDYPLAKFVGLDKVSKFPKDFSQSNLQFTQGDILEGLPFEDNSFDFVHMRFAIMEFTEEQWEEKVVKELVRVCKPGGWVEFLEIEESKLLSPSSKRILALSKSIKKKFSLYFFSFSLRN